MTRTTGTTTAAAPRATRHTPQTPRPRRQTPAPAAGRGRLGIAPPPANALSAPWLSNAERSRLRRFARAVRRIAGPDLAKICLYGSRARGEGHAESDLDVLVVVRWAPRYRRRIHDLSDDMMEAEDWPVQGGLAEVVLSKSEWQRLVDRERLFAREVLEQGLPL